MASIFFGDKMVKICCQNKRVQPNKGPDKCDRFLISLPNWVLSALKTLEGEEEGKIILKCHSCRGDSFVEIKFINGEISFVAVEGMPNLGEKLKFKNVDARSEAPLIEEA
jgi:hypothetical protein